MTPKEKKLKKLIILEYIKNNLGRIFPLLRYSILEEDFLNRLKEMLNKDFYLDSSRDFLKVTVSDIKFVLKLTFQDIGGFNTINIVKEISELQKEIQERPRERKKKL